MNWDDFIEGAISVLIVVLIITMVIMLGVLIYYLFTAPQHGYDIVITYKNG